MNLKEIQELIRLVNRFRLSEVKIENKDFKISIKANSEPAVQNLQIRNEVSDTGMPLATGETVEKAKSSPDTTGSAQNQASESKNEKAVQEKKAEDKLVIIKSPM